MKKVLVLAYQISPYRGSEYSVAWNYVQHMSKSNELVVLYGTSGDHLGDTEELKLYIEKSPVQNVRFIAVESNKIINSFNSLNKKGVFVYSFYLAYNLWQRKVYEQAKALVQQEKFDLIHLVGPIGYREPGYLWKLNLPYIWGPVGGTTQFPIKLLKALPVTGILKLGFRAIANYLQLHFNMRVRKALKNTDVLLAATTENQVNFKKIYHKESIYLPENAIMKLRAENELFDAGESLNFDNDQIKLIWIGSVDERKALIIILRALIKIKNCGKYQLHVVGDGHLKQKLFNFAEQHGINGKIVWHGLVERTKVFELLSKSHLHIITSVSEGNPTTVWEAMTAGVPTLTLDHCGMHDTICDKCGIKIPINSFDQIIDDITHSIDNLIENPDQLLKLSKGVGVCAKQFTWEQRATFFNTMYHTAIKTWRLKQR